MSDSLTAIWVEPNQCPSHHSIPLTQFFEPLCFLKWCPIFDSPCQHLWKSNEKKYFYFTDFNFLQKSTPRWLTSAKLHHWGHTKIRNNLSNKLINLKPFWVNLGIYISAWLSPSWFSKSILLFRLLATVCSRDRISHFCYTLALLVWPQL